MAIAFVLINTKLGEEKKVFDKLKVIPFVKGAYFVFGFYDIIIKISTNDFISIRKTVIEDIRRISEIESTITLVVTEKDNITESGKKNFFNISKKAKKLQIIKSYI